jgi:hypothetical protein
MQCQCTGYLIYDFCVSGSPVCYDNTMATPIISRQAVLDIRGINPYVRITGEEAALLKQDWRKPLPVCVQVNGKPDDPWHINMVPMGNGDFFLYLHNYVRQAAGVELGDNITITVWFDEAYRTGPQHPMPVWFDRVLRANNVASQAWRALPPGRQKEVLRYFYNLKSEEARLRNLERVIAALSGEPVRFMGRDWRDGK